MIKIKLSNKEREGLTQDEVEIAMARKLEILILPHLRRNINFFYAGANFPKKAKAYHNELKEEEIDEAISKKESRISVVCKPLCDTVANILRENGLNATTVSCDTDMFRHTDVLLTTSLGKQYIINYLEDIENVQTGMQTPDFASQAYYERRYKKFEGASTPDGKTLENIQFLSDEQIGKIDEKLGYKKYGMYMDDVIRQIKAEFKDFRTIMAENEYMNEEFRQEREGHNLTDAEKQGLKASITKKYQEFSDDEILEQKLDWIFDYFNGRMDISGHTDFVMYYSRLLLSQVLELDEYSKLTRYDCSVSKNNVPNDLPIKDVLDYDNNEEEKRLRFCLLTCGENVYAFSTKPNIYKKFNQEELKQLSEYANISKSQKPSDLVLQLCDKGNAVPLLFHPLGAKMLNERAELIDPSLPEEERKRELEKLVSSIKATDGDVTSITIPYPNGEEKYIYINENNEFAVRTKEGTTIYHYDEEKDSFNLEEVRHEGR